MGWMRRLTARQCMTAQPVWELTGVPPPRVLHRSPDACTNCCGRAQAEAQGRVQDMRTGAGGRSKAAPGVCVNANANVEDASGPTTRDLADRFSITTGSASDSWCSIFAYRTQTLLSVSAPFMKPRARCESSFAALVPLGASERVLIRMQPLAQLRPLPES